MAANMFGINFDDALEHGPRADYLIFLCDLDADREYEIGVVRKVASELVAVRRGYWRVRDLNLQTGRIIVRAAAIHDRPKLPTRFAKRMANG